jgi:hypothetical protein
MQPLSDSYRSSYSLRRVPYKDYAILIQECSDNRHYGTKNHGRQDEYRTTMPRIVTRRILALTIAPHFLHGREVYATLLFLLLQIVSTYLSPHIADSKNC